MGAADFCWRPETGVLVTAHHGLSDHYVQLKGTVSQDFLNLFFDKKNVPRP